MTITPRWVRLSGVSGQELKSDVKIIPEEKYPFKIINVSSKKGANIRFELKKIKESKRIAYALTIQNLKKEKGRYHDMIILKTDSDIKPEIKISVLGMIK